MPFEVGKVRVEEVSLENKELDFGHVKFERLAERCLETIWNGKLGNLMDVLALWPH